MTGVTGVGGGGGWSFTGSYGCADLGGVEVVLHEAADDGRELGLYQRDAESLQSGVDGSQSVADLLDELEYFVDGGVAGEKLVQVSDHVHADVTQQALLQATGLTSSGQEQQRNQQLHHLLRVDCECCVGNNFTGTSM